MKAKKFFIHLFFQNKFSFLFVLLFCLFSVSSGALSKIGYQEYVASYASVIAKKKSQTGKLASFLVEPNNHSTAKVPSPHSEYIATYGLFGGGTPLYAGVVNGDKTHSVYLEGINESNYSFLIADYNSNFKYNGEYRHEFYNLYLMFPGNHRFDGVYSFCYLSKSDADTILKSKGLEPCETNYKYLVDNVNIEICIDGEIFKFSIGNIYLEKGYYYNALKETIGSFMLSYVKYPPYLNKQSLYMISEFDYQNKYIMEYIKSIYKTSDYNITLNNWNLKEPETIDYNLFHNYFYSTFPIWKSLISIAFCMLAVSCLLIYFVLVTKKKIYYSKVTVVALPFVILLFYSIIHLCSLFIKPFVIFNTFTSILLFTALVVVPLYLMKLTILRKKKKNVLENYYDIVI